MRGRALVPAIVAVVAAAFFGYFALLVYCDLVRPEAEGLRLAFDGPHITVIEVAPGSPANRAGLLAGDSLLAWNGQPLDTKMGWTSVQANHQIGRPMRLGIERDGHPLDVALTLGPERPSYWRTSAGLSLLAVRAIQLITLGFALLIALRRPGDGAARLGAWVLASAGVFCFVLPYRTAAVWRDLPGAIGVALWIPYLASLVLAGSLFSFFQVFPARAIRDRWVWALAWIPMTVAVVPHLSHAFRMVYRPESMTQAPDVMLAMVIVSLGYVVATVALSTRSYRRLVDPTERRRVRVLVFGSAAGALVAMPLAVGFWLTDWDTVLFRSPLFTAGTFVALAVPLSFTYAILRHRLFDIRVIIRQGIRYALARWSLKAILPALALVAAADVAINRAVPVADLLRARLAAYLVLAGFALVASLGRHRWMEMLDARFFRDRYDARQLLGRVVEEVRRQGRLDNAAIHVVEPVESALHAEYVALLRRPPGGRGFGVVAVSPAVASPYVPPAEGAVAGILRAIHKPLEIGGAMGSWLEAQLPPDEADLVRAGRPELIVPVALEASGAESLLVLGPKRSEEPYTADDIELVATVAHSLALVAAGGPGEGDLAPGHEACPACGACLDPGSGRCPQDDAALTPSSIPRVLNERYRLDRRIGRGGMGTIYAARDGALDRMVAVKVLRPELVGEPEALERFRREARTAATVVHPNVVTVFDTGVALRQHAYLVMELLQGQTLRERLGRGPIEQARALTILKGIASGVEAAHRQRILHRDLKPENVLLVSRDGADVAKVLDFGIAKLVAEEPLAGGGRTTAFGELVGTPLYMAPEQIRGGAAEPGWDLWALAVIAYEMLAGSHPFASRVVAGAWDRHEEAAPEVRGPASRPALLPAPLGRFFDRALALDAAMRPRSAVAFIGELESALNESGGGR